MGQGAGDNPWKFPEDANSPAAVSQWVTCMCAPLLAALCTDTIDTIYPVLDSGIFAELKLYSIGSLLSLYCYILLCFSYQVPIINFFALNDQG